MEVCRHEVDQITEYRGGIYGQKKPGRNMFCPALDNIDIDV